tara:strand:- start:3677 stop:4402 length:726 start_codon:yes stop_codon:yes gene_type:complete
MDTAIDDGTNTVILTETITQGSDVFVLSINHPGDETLDDLGGGDLVVYIGTGGSVLNESYIISLTKNNVPFSFTLNSLDYDTLEEGNISLENQADLVITPNTLYALGAGTITPTITANATNISSFKITPNDTNSSNELNDFGFHNFNLTVSATLSNNNFELNQNISVYPNPSKGIFTIKNSSIALDKVMVSDLNGRIIKSYDLNGITADKELDLSSELTSGLYFMSISSKSTTVVKKIIIK